MIKKESFCNAFSNKRPWHQKCKRKKGFFMPCSPIQILWVFLTQSYDTKFDPVSKEKDLVYKDFLFTLPNLVFIQSSILYWLAFFSSSLMFFRGHLETWQCSVDLSRRSKVSLCNFQRHHGGWGQLEAVWQPLGCFT